MNVSTAARVALSIGSSSIPPEAERPRPRWRAGWIASRWRDHPSAPRRRAGAICRRGSRSRPCVRGSGSDPRPSPSSFLLLPASRPGSPRMGFPSLRPSVPAPASTCEGRMAPSGHPMVTWTRRIRLARLDDDDWDRPCARAVGRVVWVRDIQARPESRSLLRGRRSSSHGAPQAGELDLRVGLGLKVQPPGRVMIGTDVRRDDDEVRSFGDVEQAVDARLAALPPNGVEEQRSLLCRRSRPVSRAFRR